MLTLKSLISFTSYTCKTTRISTLVVDNKNKYTCCRQQEKLHTDLRKLRQGNTFRRLTLHPVKIFRKTVVASQHSTCGCLSTVKWNLLLSKSCSAQETDSSASHKPIVDSSWETVCLTQASHSSLSLARFAYPTVERGSIKRGNSSSG